MRCRLLSLKPRWLRLALIGGVLVGSSPSAWGFGWPSSAQRLERELQSEQVEVRRDAAERLVGISSRLARPLIERALSDQDKLVRLAAARAAVVLGREDVKTDLLPWLRETDAEVRRAALRVLCARPPARALDAIARAAVDQDLAVRLEAIRCLGRVSTSELGRAEGALAVALDDREAEVRALAVETAGRLSLTHLTLPLAARLQDPEETVRRRTAVALGVLAQPEGTASLTLALADPSPSVAAASARSLGQMRAVSAQNALLAALDRPTWDEVGAAAAEALGQIDTESSVRALVDHLGRESAFEDLATALRGAQAAGPLTTCLSEATGALLLGCLRVSSRLGMDLSPLVARVGTGELPATDVLAALEKVTVEPLVILVLERLELGDASEREALLGLLERSRPLPDLAAGPLVESLGSPGWSAEGRARLLELLANLATPEGLDAARPFLGSSHPRVRAAAASVIATQSDDPEEVMALLTAADVDRDAAIRGVARGLRPEMAAFFLRELRQTGGVSVSPLTWALAGADRLPAPAQNDLLALLSEARGPARDLLLDLFARQQGASVVELYRSVGVLDRRRLVASALHQPRGKEKLLVEALGDRDPWVRTLAIQACADKARLESVARDADERTFARTAALLRRAELGGEMEAGGAVPCPEDESAPLGLRLGALAALGRGSTGCSVSSADLLRQDREPLIRLMALRVLRQQDPADAAVRAAAVYEGDPLVGTAALAAGSPTGAGSEGSSPSSALVLVDREGTPRSGVPFASLTPDGKIVLGVTDRRGQVVPAGAGVVLLDPRLTQ